MRQNFLCFTNIDKYRLGKIKQKFMIKVLGKYEFLKWDKSLNQNLSINSHEFLYSHIFLIIYNLHNQDAMLNFSVKDYTYVYAYMHAYTHIHTQ